MEGDLRGRTDEEERLRREKKVTHQNWARAVRLDQQLKAYNKGWKEGWWNNERLEPRPWRDMSTNEQWWLQQLWDGKLEEAKRCAKGECPKVQAKPFVMSDDD